MSFSDIKYILLLAFILLFVAFLLQVWRSKRDRPSVLKLRSGELGSGKSLLSSKELRRQYRKCMRWYRWRKHPLFRLLGTYISVPPRVYSTIPYRVTRKVWADVLTRDMLLLRTPLPSDCCPLLLYDEIGLSANQYSFNDPNIITRNVIDDYECLEVFIRFFRHFYGDKCHDMCRVYMTEQRSGSININVRSRLGSVYWLTHFRRWLGITPFYKVDVKELMLAEDQVQNVNDVQHDADKRAEYYFGWLGYKRLSVKRYDSHAFCGVKYTGFVSELNFTNWADNDYSWTDPDGRIVKDRFKTNYAPDLRVTDEELRRYKATVKALDILAKDDAKDLIRQEKLSKRATP